MMKFLATRRFNYIDCTFVGITAALWNAGYYFSATAVLLAGCVVSVVVERLIGVTK